ncbi:MULTISPECIES: hypothetical protein [unclassified Streptomyces]|uniref:hypothetical protein n=1 Tax=unclassified Streptomyces TaxID=2593676 RepID=UPI0036E0FB30
MTASRVRQVEFALHGITGAWDRTAMAAGLLIVERAWKSRGRHAAAYRLRGSSSCTALTLGERAWLAGLLQQCERAMQIFRGSAV